MARDKLTNVRWQYLIQKYIKGTCSRDELDELLELVGKNVQEESFFNELRAYWNSSEDTLGDDVPNWAQRFDELMAEVQSAAFESLSVRQRSFLKWWQVAAAVVLIAGGALLLLSHHRQLLVKTRNSLTAVDIIPGGNKAELILADGSEIALDSTRKGAVTRQGGAVVLQKKPGQLAYAISGTLSNPTVYNKVLTPKGGQYQIVLSDGTKVRLNAASSLKFPTLFKGKKRQVELTGEGYFEVAKDADKPFEVIVNHMKVTVMGTHFDVMAYTDEKKISTTLVEGGVKVVADGKVVSLKPGQQAKMNIISHELHVSNVNVAEVIAWTNGMFNFKDTPLEVIMRQLSRWYDVEVDYQGAIPNRTFTGMMPRSANLAHVLKVLALSNINFKVVGRKIIVLP